MTPPGCGGFGSAANTGDPPGCGGFGSVADSEMLLVRTTANASVNTRNNTFFNLTPPHATAIFKTAFNACELSPNFTNARRGKFAKNIFPFDKNSPYTSHKEVTSSSANAR
jgi:hypothetical protein